MSSLIAAARRFGILLAFFAGVTVVGSLLLGLVTGSSAARAISLGFYLVGCFLLVIGFFVGNRGPIRLGQGGGGLLGHRALSWAAPSEREETLNNSAVFVVLGFAMILLGVVSDTRYPLF